MPKSSLRKGNFAISLCTSALSLPHEKAPLTTFPLPYPTRRSKRFGQNAA